jgi:hypothetical protein
MILGYLENFPSVKRVDKMITPIPLNHPRRLGRDIVNYAVDTFASLMMRAAVRDRNRGRSGSNLRWCLRSMVTALNRRLKSTCPSLPERPLLACFSSGR